MTAKSMRSTRTVQLSVHLSRVYRASQWPVLLRNETLRSRVSLPGVIGVLPGFHLIAALGPRTLVIPHQCTPLPASYLAAEFSGRVSGRSEAACAERGTHLVKTLVEDGGTHVRDANGPRPAS